LDEEKKYIQATAFETITLPVDFFLTDCQLNITEHQHRTGLSVGLIRKGIKVLLENKTLK
jgi:hypothetical protein